MILFTLLVGIMPLSEHRLWGAEVAGLTMFKWIGLACFAYAAFHLTRREGPPAFLATWQARLFVVLYVIALFSYLVKRLSIGAGLQAFQSYTSFLLLFFITLAVVDSAKRLGWTLLTAVGAVAFASLYVIREWQIYHNIYPDFRPGAVVGDPNYFTVSAVLCVPLAISLLRSSRRTWLRVFLLGSILTTLIAVTLAASRGGFLGLVAASILLMWHSRHRWRNLALVAFIAPVILLLPLAPIQRLVHPNHSDQEAGDARLVAWKAGLNMIKAYPLTGVGLGNFKAVMVGYADPNADINSIAHNTYLEIAAELGIPALLLFLVLIGVSCSSLGRARRRALQLESSLLSQAALGMEAGIVGFAVAICFLSAEYQKLFWLMILLSMCIPGLLQHRATVMRRARKLRHEPALQSTPQVEGLPTCVG